MTDEQDAAASFSEAGASVSGETEAGDLAVTRMALAGLLASPKTLPPSLFYDEEGCRLFYEITRQPEYYLTRTELRLLEAVAPEAAAMLAAGTALIEYGASDVTKADFLLRLTGRSGTPVFDAYVPIDVAAPALSAMQARLAGRYPALLVRPLVADFMRPIARPWDGPCLGFFPGSTIGNLEPEAAAGFLARVRRTLGDGARLLLGFDTNRDPARLIPAYDDAQGVTAAFNRNLLTRLNREAGADFEPEQFAHRAVWNAAESRIEMHLVSRVARTVQVGGRVVRFARDETIHTENSYKYAPERMRALAGSAAWTVERTWTDPDGVFALWLLG